MRALAPTEMHTFTHTARTMGSMSTRVLSSFLRIVLIRKRSSSDRKNMQPACRASTAVRALCRQRPQLRLTQLFVHMTEQQLMPPEVVPGERMPLGRPRYPMGWWAYAGIRWTQGLQVALKQSG